MKACKPDQSAPVWSVALAGKCPAITNKSPGILVIPTITPKVEYLKSEQTKSTIIVQPPNAQEHQPPATLTIPPLPANIQTEMPPGHAAAEVPGPADPDAGQPQVWPGGRVSTTETPRPLEGSAQLKEARKARPNSLVKPSREKFDIKCHTCEKQFQSINSKELYCSIFCKDYARSKAKPYPGEQRSNMARQIIQGGDRW